MGENKKTMNITKKQKGQYKSAFKGQKTIDIFHLRHYNVAIRDGKEMRI